MKVDLESVATEDLIAELDRRIFPDLTSDSRTVQDVYDSMSVAQKAVLHFLVGRAIEMRP